jgi:hypothetical protein
MGRLGTSMDALRVLARTNDPNRVVLIERISKSISKQRSAGRSLLLSGSVGLFTMRRLKGAMARIGA